MIQNKLVITICFFAIYKRKILRCVLRFFLVKHLSSLLFNSLVLLQKNHIRKIKILTYWNVILIKRRSIIPINVRKKNQKVYISCINLYIIYCSYYQAFSNNNQASLSFLPKISNTSNIIDNITLHWLKKWDE